ncbi:hypothetical protein C8F01DRAFT_956795, partial [Mycena amicta]
LDYAVVTVYPTTDLLGTTILVDDSSSSLIWHGSWTEENNFTLPVDCFWFTGQPSPTRPFHSSDLLPGTSISVYGVTPSDPALSWLLRMSFTLDAAQPIVVNFTWQDFPHEQPHLLYFNASSIPAGNHSLIGRIVDVVGTTLPRARIDYITYKPSFASQADMP